MPSSQQLRKTVNYAVAAALVLFALALAYAALRKPAPPAPLTLTLAVAENLLDIPVFIAIERGFYVAEGLDMRYTSFIAGKDGIQALLRREADVAMVAETPLVLNSFERRDFVILASVNYSFSNSGLITRRGAGIQSVKDLRGRRVGVIHGTTAHYFLYALLEEQGLGQGDIIEVPIPPEAMAAELVSGRVDAVAAFQPLAFQSYAALGAEALDITVGGRVRETFNYVTRPEIVAREGEALRRMLRATRRAVVWLREHRAEAVAIVAQRMKLDSAVVDALWDSYQPGVSLDQNLLLSLEAQARWAKAMGLVAGAPPNYLEMLAWSPLEAVDATTVTVIH